MPVLTVVERLLVRADPSEPDCPVFTCCYEVVADDFGVVQRFLGLFLLLLHLEQDLIVVAAQFLSHLAGLEFHNLVAHVSVLV